tara:strand:+ start:385 stop:1338 length:954 start_codon:yes stop_codon:yes gene_type:complete
MNLLVTGGCGFIGSNFIKFVLGEKSDFVSSVVNVDSLTYAGNIANTVEFNFDEKYKFEKIDIRDVENIERIFNEYSITHVCHFAAESHVDNSIADPGAFIETNIVGTFNLLNAAKKFGIERFHHVSTDEVYGDLGDTGFFAEDTPYDPRNPYSASKASSDFLVKAYANTYKLPVTISNCSNNYGPHQHQEKFIPTVIRSILNGDKVPVYGDGTNVRDWIYVDDHCSGVWAVLNSGLLGETYCIGSMCEKRNIDVVIEICQALNVKPNDYISFVEDRAGHDYRYAINNAKIVDNLGWQHSIEFVDGIKKTVEWYSERS